MSKPPRIAIYPGSFDPVTLGHEDIVRRGAELFDELTVAIGINPEKEPLFTHEERLELLREVFADLPNVKVTSSILSGVRTTGEPEAGAIHPCPSRPQTRLPSQASRSP